MKSESESRWLPMTSVNSGKCFRVAEGVYGQTIKIANICMIESQQNPGTWVLVDAGMPQSAEQVLQAVKDQFGTDLPPQAIVLTHGHFDHVGAITDLIKHWDVPVFAHPFEMPFLTGEKPYDQPDPSVEGGLVAKMSRLFPVAPVDIRSHVQPLPENGRVPFLHEWRWIHTPGHTAGHSSLYRELDQVLVAGDAFVTVRQDSLYKVLLQKIEVNGPPRYLTTDWESAKTSVQKLAQLQPKAVVTGHGVPMSGAALDRGLTRLADNFDSLAIPDYGIYLKQQKNE